MKFINKMSSSCGLMAVQWTSINEKLGFTKAAANGKSSLLALAKEGIDWAVIGLGVEGADTVRPGCCVW